MRKIIPFVVVCATLATVAWQCPAIAGQLQPSKAAVVRTSLVPAYIPCVGFGGSLFGPSGVPACGPPILLTESNPANKLTFGPKGSFYFSATSGNSDYAIVLKGIDILNNGAPYTGTLAVKLTMRITDINCGAPFFIVPCTGPDIDLRLGNILSVSCKTGRCAAKTSANQIVPGLLGPGKTTGIEFRDIVVLDPDFDQAFRPGLIIP